LWVVYIPHFDQISVKFQFLGSYTLTVAPMGVKFGTEDETLIPSSVRNFIPIGATCRPCGAKKPQNRPLSKLNSGTLHFAQCCR